MHIIYICILSTTKWETQGVYWWIRWKRTIKQFKVVCTCVIYVVQSQPQWAVSWMLSVGILKISFIPSPQDTPFPHLMPGPPAQILRHGLHKGVCIVEVVPFFISGQATRIYPRNSRLWGFNPTETWSKMDLEISDQPSSIANLGAHSSAPSSAAEPRTPGHGAVYSPSPATAMSIGSWGLMTQFCNGADGAELGSGGQFPGPKLASGALQ